MPSRLIIWRQSECCDLCNSSHTGRQRPRGGGYRPRDPTTGWIACDREGQVHSIPYFRTFSPPLAVSWPGRFGHKSKINMQTHPGLSFTKGDGEGHGTTL